MFHAGEVMPSSLLLLQLLSFASGERVPPSVVLDEFEPPVIAGLSARDEEGMAVELDMPLALLMPRFLPKVPKLEAPLPVCAGLMAPARLGPMAERNLLGNSWLAKRLKAPIHCRTWVGSFAS
jgi:hypothetical protein